MIPDALPTSRVQPPGNSETVSRPDTRSPTDSILRAYEDRSDAASAHDSLASVTRMTTERGEGDHLAFSPCSATTRRPPTTVPIGELPQHQARQLLRHNSKPWLANRTIDRRPSEPSCRDSASIASMRDLEGVQHVPHRSCLSASRPRKRAHSLIRCHRYETLVYQQQFGGLQSEKTTPLTFRYRHDRDPPRYRSEGNLRQFTRTSSSNTSRPIRIKSPTMGYEASISNRAPSFASITYPIATKFERTTPSASSAANRAFPGMSEELVTAKSMAPQFWDYSEGYMDLVDMYADAHTPCQVDPIQPPSGREFEACSTQDNRVWTQGESFSPASDTDPQFVDSYRSSGILESPKPLPSPQALQKQLSVWNRSPPFRGIQEPTKAIGTNRLRPEENHGGQIIMTKPKQHGFDWSRQVHENNAAASPLNSSGICQARANKDVRALYEEQVNPHSTVAVPSLTAAGSVERRDLPIETHVPEDASCRLSHRRGTFTDLSSISGTADTAGRPKATRIHYRRPFHRLGESNLPRPDSETIPIRGQVPVQNFSAPSPPRPDDSAKSKYIGNDKRRLATGSQTQEHLQQSTGASETSTENTEDTTEETLSALNHAYIWTEIPARHEPKSRKPVGYDSLQMISGAPAVHDQRSKPVTCAKAAHVLYSGSDECFRCSVSDDVASNSRTLPVPEIWVTPPTPELCLGRNNAAKMSRAGGLDGNRYRKQSSRERLTASLKKSFNTTKNLGFLTNNEVGEDSVATAVDKAARGRSKGSFFRRVKSWLVKWLVRNKRTD